MASEDEKPLHKQFLRVRNEEDEDSWISGEELKTEGSSGSDEEVSRRKMCPRKSRRRRSEGYNPSASRLSLPNLNDNKAGIAFSLSKSPDVDESNMPGERISIGGALTKTDEDKFKLESAMARMKTTISLDKSCDFDEFIESESDWRPKRGSLKLPSLEEASPSCSTIPTNWQTLSEQCTNKPTISLPNLTRKKMIRFSNEVRKIDGFDDPPSNETEPDKSKSKEFHGHLNDYLDKLDEREDYIPSDEDSNMLGRSLGFSDSLSDLDSPLGDDDSEDNRKLQNNEPNSKHKEWKPILNRKLKLPDLDADNIDSSVKQFVADMDNFYNEMSTKLKSLKNSAILKDVDPGMPVNSEMNTLGNLKVRNSFKDLKRTPQVQKALHLITKMDNDISDTLSQFKEERSQRLDIQRQLMNNIPRDRESQLFFRLCKFEVNDTSSSGCIPQDKNKRMKNKRKGERKMIDKNFIERNIELAKVGMNFSLSDEQKQRLERILLEEVTDPATSVDENEATDQNQSQDSMNDNCQSCTLNAFRFSKNLKERLIEIDSALKALDVEEAVASKESKSSLGTVGSLKEIDEKLDSLSATRFQDEELLKESREKTDKIKINGMKTNFVKDQEQISLPKIDNSTNSNE